ncbi:MAG: hypothetical protein CMF48_04125 [Legionellales bacterium]|nr:hypothetical protein [Legionellales bacterium]
MNTSPNYKTSALIVITSPFISDDLLETVSNRLKYRFSHLFHADYAFSYNQPSAAKKYTIDSKHINDYKFSDYEIILVVLSPNCSKDFYNLIDFNRTRVYEADTEGMIRYAFKALDEIEYPELNSHIFNKINAKMGNERLTFFPYTFSSQYVGLGPIDEFGHRIPKPLFTYRNRSAKERLICIFGGSAAWSIKTSFSDMFSNQLEMMLNERSDSLKYTVLNLGQPSGLLLNDLFRYLLFVQNLNPDLVICHGGANDLSFSQTSDQYLLEHYNLTYQFHLEEWAHILSCHESNESFSFNQEESLRVKSYPRQIISSFLTRLKQFEKVSESFNSKFIFGLQPTVYSRNYPSTDEVKILQNENSHQMYAAFKNLDFLYEKMLSQKNSPHCKYFVNHHHAFSLSKTQKALMADSVHTTKDGDYLIAKTYTDFLFENNLIPLSHKETTLDEIHASEN